MNKLRETFKENRFVIHFITTVVVVLNAMFLVFKRVFFLPVYALPSTFNNLLLILGHSIALYTRYLNGDEQWFTNPTVLLLLLLLVFPPSVFLIPFYIAAIHQIALFIDKSIEADKVPTIVKNTAVYVRDNFVTLLRLMFFFEILNVFMAFCLLFKSTKKGFKLLILTGAILIQQYRGYSELKGFINNAVTVLKRKFEHVKKSSPVFEGKLHVRNNKAKLLGSPESK
ncbi:hypothetical protein HERIO_1180 [Hepatospora eriocheir]|uniref:Uncharacterized protein n=1 Tax=Hepatospora eriocheir TaxID=1081669 RepID=A0A1X0QAU1_9MICR|nr:hypothetical protein HERIO_1180 [Hepatospora eriocheir]